MTSNPQAVLLLHRIKDGLGESLAQFDVLPEGREKEALTYLVQKTILCAENMLLTEKAHTPKGKDVSE